MNLKKNLNEIIKNWRNKEWWHYNAGCYLLQSFYKRKKNKGTFVEEEDWDNLIILDACRYDFFKELTGIDSDKLTYKISRGSTTSEFLKENFANRNSNDIVYVTGNPMIMSPMISRVCKNAFYKIIHVWKNGWDEEFDTVLPETMVEYALRAEERYPNKRLIIHFIQPHFPYIKDPDILLHGFYEDELRAKGLSSKGGGLGDSISRYIRQGKLDRKEVYKNWRKRLPIIIQAYKRNLEAVIPHAFELADKLEGKTVITSDHGEAFDDFATPFPIKVMGHPGYYIHTPVLVKVPWLVFDSKKRKQIEKGDEKKRLEHHIKNVKAELKNNHY